MSKYGYTYIDTIERLTIIMDGLNEKGVYPDRVYLGKKEIEAMKEQHRNIHAPFEGVGVMTIFGVEIEKVDKEYHVGMGFSV